MFQHATKRRCLARVACAAFATGVAALAPAWAQDPPCAADALEEWSCAKEVRGSAVIDTLGRVVCAPGACVEYEGEWVCSSEPGGTAGLDPEGPVCDGECRAPSIQDCEKL